MLDVYFSRLPRSEMLGELVPGEREDELCAIENETLRREKYFVWRLLEEALVSSLGLTLKEAGLYKGESGKWLASVCEISLSHSGELIAVAVSSKPVGIDVERKIAPRSATFAERILTDAELSRYNSLSDGERGIYLTECWTKKEAMFKALNLPAFVPKNYDSDSPFALCRRIDLDGEEYVLAVASECVEHIKYKQTI